MRRMTSSVLYSELVIVAVHAISAEVYRHRLERRVDLLSWRQTKLVGRARSKGGNQRGVLNVDRHSCEST